MLMNKTEEKDLLTGTDHYHKLFTDEIIRGKKGEPFA